MAQNEETIKEFLVGVKFKPDQPSQEKTKSNIEQFGRRIAQVLAVGAVVKFTDSLEQLYFQTKRTGASAQNLRSLEFAGKRFGATAEELSGSVLNLSNALRRMPGTESLLRGLGVNARDANGQMRDRVEILKDLGKQLAKMDPAQQAVYADQFGISDDTLRAITSADFDKEYKKYQDKLAKANLKSATENAHKTAGVFSEAAADAQSAVTKLGGEALGTLNPILQKSLDLFEKLDKATGGWASNLLIVTAAAKALGFSFGGGAAAKAAASAAASGAAGSAATGAAAGGVAATASKGASLFSRALGGAGLFFYSSDLNKGENAEIMRRRNMAPTIDAPSKAREASKDPKINPRVAAFVEQHKDVAIATGARLGVAPEALLGQWGLETGWGKSVIPGTNNLGNIKDFSGNGVTATDNMNGSVDKYRKYDSPEAFSKDYAGLISRRYKSSLNSGNDVSKYFSELKKGGYAEDPNYVKSGTAASNMARAALQNINATSQPSIPMGIAQGGSTQGKSSVEQNVTINVNGVTNPMEASRIVAQNQSRVNSELVRNLGQRAY